MGANTCIVSKNGKVVLIEEMLVNDNCREMALPVIVELIDNCNIDDLKCIKDKFKEDIKK